MSNRSQKISEIMKKKKKKNSVFSLSRDSLQFYISSLLGAGLMGVSVRGWGRTSVGAGLQENLTATELPRTVGCVARGGRQSGPQTT